MSINRWLRSHPALLGGSATLITLAVALLVLQALLPDQAIALADLTFVLSALLLIWLVIGVYISQRNSLATLVRFFGGGTVALLFPFAGVLLAYWSAGRSWWVLALTGVVLVYLFVEFLLDFVFSVPFRSHLLQHVLYILLFYAALGACIGIAFSAGPTWGYAVSASFWLLLGALVYNLRGHGVSPAAGPPTASE